MTRRPRAPASGTSRRVAHGFRFLIAMSVSIFMAVLRVTPGYQNRPVWACLPVSRTRPDNMPDMPVAPAKARGLCPGVSGRVRVGAIIVDHGLLAEALRPHHETRWPERP